jgi:hypothetical protein
MQARTSSWRWLARVLQGLFPSRPVSPAVRYADELGLRLSGGAPLGAALRASFPALARVAVKDAARRFEGGAVALFIVDLRDALASTVAGAANELERRDASTWRVLSRRLEAFAEALSGDTFVQHLVNTCLEATQLYTESMPLEPEALDVDALAAAVAALLSRSLGAVLSRAELAQTTARRTYSGGVRVTA